MGRRVAAAERLGLAARTPVAPSSATMHHMCVLRRRRHIMLQLLRTDSGQSKRGFLNRSTMRYNTEQF
jgi:hypothetical protein